MATSSTGGYSDDLQPLFVTLERIEAKLDLLLAGRAQPPQRTEERDEDLVGTDYVAKLFGCAEKSARRGQAGTKLVPWIRDAHGRRVRPLKVTRRGAREAHRAFVAGRPPEKKRSRGLIRRKPDSHS